jgi:hypothetical protein
MTGSAKAALWSGLVFPGIGQLMLKRRLRGSALVLISLVSFVFLLTQVYAAASAAADRLLESQDSMDYGMIRKAAEDAVHGISGYGTRAAVIVLGICWAYGIVDAVLEPKKPGP